MKIKQCIRCQLIYAVLIIMFIIVFIININTGNVHISPIKIFQIVILKWWNNTAEYSIIWHIRLPRLITAAILGGALSLSGFLLQTFFRNPIAGPFVLGISSGAKMFVAVTMIFFLKYIGGMPLWLQIISAFIGSMLSMIYVLIFAKRVKSMSMLLVIGIMISYVCSAITDLCVTFASDSDIATLTHWSLGSFSGSSWTTVKIAAIIVIPVAIITFVFSKPIGAYQLGEGYARNMGVNIGLLRVIIIVLSSLLSASVTALAGPISFVGIAVPHITRLLLKSSKPILSIPAMFINGAVFCMFCDWVARTLVSPTELTMSTVTAVFGAPVVIWLMISRNNKI